MSIKRSLSLFLIILLPKFSWSNVAKVDTATGHGCSGNSCSTASITATISAGVTCAIAGLNFRNNVTVTGGGNGLVWDPAGANQTFTRINTGIFNGSRSEMFYLINPTAGASKNLTATWTTASDIVFTLATFSGTDTSTCIKSADTATNSGTSTSVTVTINGATGDAVVGTGGQDTSNWTSTTGGTQITLDDITFVNGAGSYFDPNTSTPTGATNTTSWSQGSSGAWSAMGVHVIVPAISASIPSPFLIIQGNPMVISGGSVIVK